MTYHTLKAKMIWYCLSIINNIFGKKAKFGIKAIYYLINKNKSMIWK